MALEFEAPGQLSREILKKLWKDVNNKDVAEVGVRADNALDRTWWRRITGTANPATDGTYRSRVEKRLDGTVSTSIALVDMWSEDPRCQLGLELITMDKV